MATFGRHMNVIDQKLGDVIGSAEAREMEMITEITRETFDDVLPALTEILHASVRAGASIGFIEPFHPDDAMAFWTGIGAKLAPEQRILWVARQDERVVGTVQLDIDMMPNQPHRCEVAKLMVHPDARGQGHAVALMQTLEQRALDLGKSQITLDTRTGDKAEPLYQKLGYHTAGVIPNFCLDPQTHALDSTTYMYKILT